MSDDTPNTSLPPSTGAPPLSAASEDHRDEAPRRKLGTFLMLGGAAGVALLALAISVLIASADGRPEDDPLHRLSLDVAGTRADMQLLEDRLEQVEALEGRLSALNQRLEELEAGMREQLAGMQGYGARLETLEERLDRVSSQADVRMAALDERLESILTEAEAAMEQAEKDAQQASQEAGQDQARAAQETQQTRTPRPAAPPRPPFRIAGVEHRGGRPYLSVATGSGPVDSLSEVHLLGEREVQEEWQLVSIGGATAEFLVRGRSVTVQLP